MSNKDELATAFGFELKSRGRQKMSDADKAEALVKRIAPIVEAVKTPTKVGKTVAVNVTAEMVKVPTSKDDAAAKAIVRNRVREFLASNKGWELSGASGARNIVIQKVTK